MASYASKVMRMAAIAAATALALSACNKGTDAAQGAKDGKGQQAAAQKEAPPPVVGVVTVHPETVALTTELPGRLESLRTADVRAQVGGIIQKRLFQEGSYVRAGQPLYQIDSSTYEANLESSRAQLASAQATLAKANADLARYKPLVAADAISKQDYDAAVTAKRSAEASVKAAQAAIKSAGINLNRARITAPISGFIGQSKVSEGTLLNAGDTTVLATIRQTNPMYVNITQSATEVMKLRQQVAEGKLSGVDGAIEVGIKFDNGEVYPHKGRLLFSDPSVNETTGQITLRASVPNDKNILMPGCATMRQFSPMRQLCPMWTRLSIFVPLPITVAPRVARSTPTCAPISTSSSTTTPPTCGTLVCTPASVVKPNPSAPMTAQLWIVQRAPMRQCSRTTAFG